MSLKINARLGDEDADLSRLSAAEAGREEADSLLEGLMLTTTERDAARAQRDAALARVERLEKALRPFAEHGRLYAGWLRKGTAPCPRREDFEAARTALSDPSLPALKENTEGAES